MPTSKKTVSDFWDAMATNDFALAAQLLDPGFAYYMPQSQEYLEGPEAFAAVNTAYPTEGRWSFAVRSIVAEGDEAVSDVAVTDGTVHGRAITFHTVRDGLIFRQVEYWPDPYPAPEWRKAWMSHRDDFPF